MTKEEFIQKWRGYERFLPELKKDVDLLIQSHQQSGNVGQLPSDDEIEKVKWEMYPGGGQFKERLAFVECYIYVKQQIKGK